MADDPKTEVIFCLLKLTAADGTVSYDASGEATTSPMPQADREELEQAGKAALGVPSFAAQNRDLITQIKGYQQRIGVLEAALEAANVPVPA